MLKEVGASGQISLGKKYAGQLFDVVSAPDGRVELVPMKAVPTVGESASFQYPKEVSSAQHMVQDVVATYKVGDGWLTPARLRARAVRPLIKAWALENAKRSSCFTCPATALSSTQKSA